MKKSEELPEAEIERAEERAAPHHHGVMDEDGLREHLRSPHTLDAPEHLSHAALEGLHDRLHQESDAEEI